MYLYIGIYILLFVLSFIFDYLARGKNKYYIIVYNTVYIFLALLVAIRYGVGSDTPRCMLIFEEIPTLSHLSVADFGVMRSQPLYIIINSVCKSIYNDFFILQIVQSFLLYHSLYLVFKFLDLRKFYLLICFYGYVYFQEQTAMRECFGLSFCFYGLYFYLKRSIKWFFLFVTLGFFCHSSMILFYILPFFSRIKTLNNRTTFILLGALFIIFYLLASIQNALLMFGDSSISRYSIDDDLTLRLSTIVWGSVLLYTWYFYCSKKVSNKYIEFVYLGLIYIIFEMVGQSMLPILYRFTAHLVVFYFFCISIIFSRIKRNSILYFVFALFLYYTPVSRFLTGIRVDPSLEYCTVFSSDKSHQNKLIREAESYDVYLHRYMEK